MVPLFVFTLSPAQAADSTPGARLVPQVGHRAFVRQLSFDASGQRILTASDDGTAAVWDAESGTMVLRLASHEGGVLAASFSSDGERIRTASAAGEIVTWSATSGVELQRAKADDTWWTSAVFVGDEVLAVDREEQARFWSADANAGRALATPIRSVGPHSVSERGRWIAAVTSDSTVGVFKGRSGALKTQLTATTERLRGVAISPSGREVLTTDGSATLKRWSARTASLVDSYTAPDGTSLFYARFGGPALALALDQRNHLHVVGSPGQPPDPIDLGWSVHGAIAVGPGGARFAASGGSGPAPVWNDQGEVVATLTGQVRAATVVGAVKAGFLPVGHHDGKVTVWSPYSGRLRQVYDVGREPVDSVDIHMRGLMLATTARNVVLYNVRAGAQPLFKLERDSPTQRAASLSFDARELYVADAFAAEAWKIDPFRTTFVRRRISSGFLTTEATSIGPVETFKARGTPARVPADLRVGDDGSIRIVDPDTGAWRGSFYVFEDGNWAVTDPDGRFDAGDDQALDGLTWIIDGLPYRLSQLRDRFFEPGLLAKLLGHNSEPLREVPELAGIEAPPAVHASGPTSEGAFEIRLEDRGSGIGPLWATLNGSDITAEVEARCPAVRNGEPCALDLSSLPTWVPGATNQVRIEAGSGNGMLRSRGLDSFVDAAGVPIGDPPDLWVLSIGTGDYAGEDLDLTYAAGDAISIGRALGVAGARGFGAERTHVRVLSTVDTEGVYARPSREAIADAFDWLTQADPLDTVLVFFSGHGAAHTDSADDDYYYLLPSASSFTDIRDPQLRAIRTWSGQELASAMSRIPALKRLVVLDTCAAGKVDGDLSAPRSLSSDAIRAHARSRERTGAWLLAGAAADKVSYEASRFGQGVLTYALLEGMRGPALDDGDLLMVSRWLGWAEQQVPTYAAGIGGVQRPITRRGSADDFPVGQLPPAERDDIPVTRVRPVVVSASVVGRGGRQDALGCTASINAALRDQSHHADASFAYWDSDPATHTWQITGTCSESGGKIRLDGFVTRTGDDGAETEHALKVQARDVASLGDQAVRSALPLLEN